MLQVRLDLNGTMVVAVVPMRVMQSAVNDVVDMVSMGNRLMTATRTVDMGVVVLDRLAMVRIRSIDLQTMLIVVVAMLVMHMTVVQVIEVVPVLYLGMATVLAVLVVVVFMHLTVFLGHHQLLASCWLSAQV